MPHGRHWRVSFDHLPMVDSYKLPGKNMHTLQLQVLLSSNSRAVCVLNSIEGAAKIIVTVV